MECVLVINTLGCGISLNTFIVIPYQRKLKRGLFRIALGVCMGNGMITSEKSVHTMASELEL